MKTPRVQDFDPNAKIPTLGSPMENMPAIQKPEKQKPKLPSPVSTPASMIESKQASYLASKRASMLSLTPATLELIRKTVKNPGKEQVLYIRLSQEEKAGLGDVSYTYKRQGMKTSDNEIVRIAVNTLLEDYKANGDNSILAQLLASLHA